MSAFSVALSSRTNGPLPLVQFSKWNNKVTESAASFEGSESERYKRFPSTKIQSTVDGMVRADEELRSRGETQGVESTGTVHLGTTMAEKLSEALSGAPKLGKDYVEKWAGYWEVKGLFV